MSKSLVTGIPQLRRRLEALKDHLEGKVLPGELKAGAELFASRVRQNAPVESGRLADSVGVVVQSPLSVEVEVTGGHPTPIVADVEYGRIGQAPQPFIRNSYSQVVRGVRDDIAGAIARGVRRFSNR